MKKLLLLILALLCLTACGQTEVPNTKPEPMPAADAETEEPAREYQATTVHVDGTQLDGILFGGKPLVNCEAFRQLVDPRADFGLTAFASGKMYGDASSLNYDVLIDGTHLYLSDNTPWVIPEGYKVPILMYHGVSDDLWGMTDLFVSPSNMEAQIQYLLENGYTPIWFEDLPNVDKIEKPVILSYDDGYLDNYTDLLPILQKYQVKATIFVVTGTMDYNPRSLTSQQVKELSDSGLVSIQSHTVTHPYLMHQSPEEQEYELAYSQEVLWKLTGKCPRVLCYPSGSYDQTTLELTKRYYQMGIDMNGNLYTTGNDPYQVQRFYISRRDGVGTVASYIQ